jgi:TetR/AcrR family transcriptional regulator, cholesterol catabolism regulator
LRDAYDREFAALVDALPLPSHTDRKALRLLLLGALNWSRFWFHPQGAETPASLARKFVQLLKEKQDA